MAMEFMRESEMLEPAKRWLESLGLVTKTEFVNPWGVCDLVGCTLNKGRVANRLALKQRAPIGTPLRIALLDHVPDRETGRSVTLQKLQRDHAALVDRQIIARELEHLVSTRFVQVTARGSFQRVNGWLPLHDRLVTVELKLSRVREALFQAVGNRELTCESYAAFPLARAQRILDTDGQKEFKRSGVGILGVTPTRCAILLRPTSKSHRPDNVAQIHCIERFWREHVRGS